MQCANCGNELAATAAFCGRCGVKTGYEGDTVLSLPALQASLPTDRLPPPQTIPASPMVTEKESDDAPNAVGELQLFVNPPLGEAWPSVEPSRAQDEMSPLSSDPERRGEVSERLDAINASLQQLDASLQQIVRLLSQRK